MSKSKSINYNNGRNVTPLEGGPSQRSFQNASRRSVSRRSFRPTNEDFSELPDDKEQLIKIIKMKEDHIKNMQKNLNEVETDVLENDMITDLGELANIHSRLTKEDQRLAEVIKNLPKKLG